MGKNNSMPIVFGRFAEYNINHDSGLSADEIEKMPDRDASSLFLFSVGKQTLDAKFTPITYRQAISVFDELTPQKRAAILSKISDSDVSSEYFALIAADNVESATELLIESYKTYKGDHPENLCLLLFKKTRDDLKSKIMLELKDREPIMAREIENWEETILNMKKGYVLPTHPSSSEAIAETLEEKKPLMVAFGESHGFGKQLVEGVPTTAERFADEIMPVLAANGYYDVVVEYFPYDINPMEFEYYFRTGEIDTVETPILKILLEYEIAGEIGTRGITSILNSAIRLRDAGHPINIHGGFMSTEDIRLAAQGKLSLDQALEKVARATASQAAGLIDDGKLVATYNGGLHNDISEELSNTSIYPLLVTLGKLTSSSDFLEVDLVVPAYVDEGDFSWNLLKRSSPENGVHMIDRYEQSKIIVFPKKTVTN